MDDKVLLGFEVGTGERVSIPVRHLAVTGQTQESGKTTTLEALISRSGRAAVAFITKRGEGSFHDSKPMRPFVRERADWQFVSAILEATFREKMKFERSWIMKVCRGARSLTDVHRNVQSALKSARGLSESVYTTLDEYLKIVVPELRGLTHEEANGRWDAFVGVNAMDLSPFSPQVQQLVIASVLERVYTSAKKMITVIPEAWEFVPQARNSPVKVACETLVRKGAALGNYVWLDSQDLAGVDKSILKQVSVWILGVQREINEVEHTLDQIPLSPKSKPKVADVQTLQRGVFYVCHGDSVRKVYVCPAWVPEEVAWNIAKHNVSEAAKIAAQYRSQETYILDAKKYLVVPEASQGVCSRHGSYSGLSCPSCEDDMYREKYESLVSVLRQLGGKEDNGQWVFPYFNGDGTETMMTAPALVLARRKAASEKPEFRNEQNFVGMGPVGAEFDYELFRNRLLTDPKVMMQLKIMRPALSVEVERKVIAVTTNSLRGQIAKLILDGFFRSPITASAVFAELERRCFQCGRTTVYEEMDSLTTLGFFRKEKCADRSYRYSLNEVEIERNEIAVVA